MSRNDSTEHEEFFNQEKKGLQDIILKFIVTINN